MNTQAQSSWLPIVWACQQQEFHSSCLNDPIAKNHSVFWNRLVIIDRLIPCINVCLYSIDGFLWTVSESRFFDLYIFMILVFHLLNVVRDYHWWCTNVFSSADNAYSWCWISEDRTRPNNFCFFIEYPYIPQVSLGKNTFPFYHSSIHRAFLSMKVLDLSLALLRILSGDNRITGEFDASIGFGRIGYLQNPVMFVNMLKTVPTFTQQIESIWIDFTSFCSSYSTPWNHRISFTLESNRIYFPIHEIGSLKE